ncbi:MAG TPA: glycerol-3-phosphate dehydrogenase/oxidase, partial [Blastocatellia bacterium]|nr:glycerol-3-phosphate dehydrogenase/oxidase [Blastocatellia bacterium]
MESTFDVIIAGAGINGTGIARDAAMRGLKVLLLDKGDLCAGTTAYSTRLIHGGLRYLEHGEIGLVRESLRERESLLRIAPHLVRPIQLMIPIYRNARRGRAKIRAGMIAYDLLSIRKSLERHKMLSVPETLDQAPGLEPKGLIGAAVYYDAQVEYAERLVVENAMSAREHGARLLTYSRVDRIAVNPISKATGNELGVDFTDLIDGSTGSVTAPVVINAAGPWVDLVVGKVTSVRQRAGRMIGGTKGSHIIVAGFTGAPNRALYSEARTDGRPFFVIPWTGLYLIGTTDIRYSGDLDRVRADESEIEYLIRATNRLLPAAKLSRESVIY